MKKQPKNAFDELPLFLTVPDLAAVLGIGLNSAYNMVRKGQIRHVRAGNQIRIPRDALKDL